MGAPETTNPVEIGDLVAGKYRVERVLGKGGMGLVVAAIHVELGQQVAVKFLLPGIGTSPPILARFEREARAAAGLQSEHVTRVLDVGRLPDGCPFMVMEMLEGTDLAELLRARRRLPPHEVVGYLLEACDAIAEAHGAGIVHRDIKPANLFLAERRKRAPIIKVLDFGISKVSTLSGDAKDITHTTELIGSPLYMSPEQLRAPKTVDARSDVWSLGATAYELISGKPPFDGNTVAELSANIMMTPLVSIAERCGAALAPGLAEVIDRCLEKDPDARFRTVEDLAGALRPFAEPHEADAAPSPPEEAPLATTAPALVSKGNAGKTLPILPGPKVASPPVASRPEASESPAPVPPAEGPSLAVSEAAVSFPPPATAMAGGGRRTKTLIGAGLVLVGAGALALVATRESGSRPTGATAATGSATAEIVAAPSTSPTNASASASPAPPSSSVAAPPSALTPAPSSLAPPPSALAIRKPPLPATHAPSALPSASPPPSSSAAPAPARSESPLKLKLE